MFRTEEMSRIAEWTPTTDLNHVKELEATEPGWAMSLCRFRGNTLAEVRTSGLEAKKSAEDPSEPRARTIAFLKAKGMIE